MRFIAVTHPWATTCAAVVLAACCLVVAPTTSGASSPSSASSPVLEVTPTAVDRQLQVRLVGQTLVDPTTVSGRTKQPVPLSGILQLPIGYEEGQVHSPPLLVLLHGAGGTSTTWFAQGALAADRRLDDVVVLSLDGGSYGMYTDWRRLGAARWLALHRAIIDAVVQRFDVSADRADHAIVGVSMGGQGALRYAGARPDFFGTVGALSPALPDMRAPEAVASYPIQTSLKAGTPVRYSDTWGGVWSSRAREANPMDNVSDLASTAVHLTSGTGLPCPRHPLASDPSSSATEAGIARQTRAYARALASARVPVTTTFHCGGHGDWRWWLKGFDEVLALWAPTSTGTQRRAAAPTRGPRRAGT